MSDDASAREPDVELPIRGCVVHEIWFWGIVRLKLVRDDFEASIDFAAGTFAKPSDLEQRAFNTEQEIEAVHWFVDLWRQRARRGSISADGMLRVEFENGAVLAVPPEDGVEAWNYSDSSKHHVIALPSGGIAWWDTPLPGIEAIDGRNRTGPSIQDS